MMHNADQYCYRVLYDMKRFSGLIVLIVISLVSAEALDLDEDVRSLSFYHTHTAEELSVTYYSNGAYNNEALAELNHFLRDFRTRDEIEMDPAVLDILFDIQQDVGSTGVYQIISAYRSPATNEMLRSSSSGVAKNSQHVLGNAIDVRLRNVDTKNLRDAAISQKRGGVGYYKDSNFVHIDVGRVRQW